MINKTITYCLLLCLMSCQAKKTYIFDFDQTISKNSALLEVYNTSLNYNIVKMQYIKNLIQQKSKIVKGVVSYLVLPDVEKMINRKITKQDFTIASNNLIKYSVANEIKDIIAKLHQEGHQVFIIGGGYGACDVISNVAKELNINTNNVYSGLTTIDSNGFYVNNQYIGFYNCNTKKQITNNFTKSDVIKYLKKEKLVNDYIIHIGDGINDLEVWQSKEVNMFVGFGIYKVDNTVKINAPVFIENFNDFKKYAI
jgi:HAD superfamily phosphoserine phosphatase-like hydrolase